MTYERFVQVIQNGEDLILKIEGLHDKVWVPLYEFPMAYISSIAVETPRQKLDSERAKNVRLRDENDKFKAKKAARVGEQALLDATSKFLAMCNKIEAQGRSIRALEEKFARNKENERHYGNFSYSGRSRDAFKPKRGQRDDLAKKAPPSSSSSSFLEKVLQCSHMYL